MEDKIEQKNNPLRKGNYVKDSQGKVIRLTQYNVYRYHTVFKEGINYFGIKLNRNIIHGITRSTSTKKEAKDMCAYLMVEDYGFKWGTVELRYLHELQNLYERVYGEELQIDFYEIKDGIS